MRDRKKAAALDAALTDMFGSLQARPVPEHVQRVVDQLEQDEPAKPSPSRSSSPEP